MPDTETKDKKPESYSSVAGNAPGGRNGNSNGGSGTLPDVGKAVSDVKPKELGSKPAGFGMDGEDVKGSLKIHIKLDLEADIRVVAKVKGDIAIGLL